MPLAEELAAAALIKASRPVWGSMPSTRPVAVVTVTGVPGASSGLVTAGGGGTRQGGCVVSQGAWQLRAGLARGMPHVARRFARTVLQLLHGRRGGPEHKLGINCQPAHQAPQVR